MRQQHTSRRRRGSVTAAMYAHIVLMALVLAVGAGCGEAQLVVQESLPMTAPVGSQLPGNLLQSVEYYGAPESDHVVVIMERFSATERVWAEGSTIRMSASGIVRAASPVDIQALSVIVRPRLAGATWQSTSTPGARMVTYPAQMSAGTEAHWVWTDTMTAGLGPGEITGVDVRTRIVFEVLQ
jgi:hypothetical protein